MPDYVCGNADELRRLADLLDANQDQPAIAAADTLHERRVAAMQARYPGVPIASLSGRVFCGPTDAPRVNARCWHTIRNLDIGSIADMYIYGEIGEFGVSAADVVYYLNSIDTEVINVYLNSPGGELFDGMAIRNKLRDHPAHVEVKVDALAASVATIVAMAGNKIVMNRQSRMMIHDAWAIVLGNSADMRQMADTLDVLSDDMAGIYAVRAGGSAPEWRKLMKAETWFSAQASVARGLADEAIIDIPESVAVVASLNPVAGPKPPLTAVPQPATDPCSELAALLGGMTKEAVS